MKSNYVRWNILHYLLIVWFICGLSFCHGRKRSNTERLANRIHFVTWEEAYNNREKKTFVIYHNTMKNVYKMGAEIKLRQRVKILALFFHKDKSFVEILQCQAISMNWWQVLEYDIFKSEIWLFLYWVGINFLTFCNKSERVKTAF